MPFRPSGTQDRSIGRQSITAGETVYPSWFSSLANKMYDYLPEITNHLLLFVAGLAFTPCPNVAVVRLFAYNWTSFAEGAVQKGSGQLVDRCQERQRRGGIDKHRKIGK